MSRPGLASQVVIGFLNVVAVPKDVTNSVPHKDISTAPVSKDRQDNAGQAENKDRTQYATNHPAPPAYCLDICTKPIPSTAQKHPSPLTVSSAQTDPFTKVTSGGALVQPDHDMAALFTGQIAQFHGGQAVEVVVISTSAPSTDARTAPGTVSATFVIGSRLWTSPLTVCRNDPRARRALSSGYHPSSIGQQRHSSSGAARCP